MNRMTWSWVLGTLVVGSGLIGCAEPRPTVSIYKAAADGNVVELRSNLRYGADPNQIASNGELPLHYAAASGNPRAVDLLLAAGADLNAPDVRYGTTALNAAVIKGDRATAQLLLEAGCSLTPVEGHYGYPPSALHDAASRGDRPMVDLLVSYGAPLHLVSVTVGDFDGTTKGTPADFADRAGHRELARYLRELAQRAPQMRNPPSGNRPTPEVK